MRATAFFLSALLTGFTGSVSAQLPGSNNNSISITYNNSIRKTGNPDFTARINSTRDAEHGVAYNGGNAAIFNISSPQNYTVRISSRNSNGDNFSESRDDIRNHIFYSIADNNTGGRNYGPAVQPLGTEEKTLFSDCPPTRLLSEGPDNHYRSFSLFFSVKPGYSIAPGNYITEVILTATTE